MTQSQYSNPALAVFPAAESCLTKASDIAKDMGFPLIDNAQAMLTEPFPLLIWVDENGIGLRQSGRKAPNPIVIDFVGGALGFRGKHSPHAKELVANAVGAKAGHTPTVLDATAGLGRDAFILASRGCSVIMLERSPVVALMLEDALRRAQLDPEVSPVTARMQLYQADACQFMTALSSEDYPEVVYLDPMFPERSKSASVKKEMRLLQQLLGADMDTLELFETALTVATRRVVVKRPKLAPCISELKPHHVVEGKSGRFDIYHTRALE
ncbi:SAM-dependent methyltransferase [gamma proteobacterium IMCC2047]|nr:SAM-dependent methyltransferase [gamma proteobacterium IMCC2047]